MKSLLLALSILCLPVSARIGETKEGCIGRYGPITKEGKNDDPYTVHEKAGMRILVSYWKDRAVLLYIVKIEEDDIGKSLAISENEIDIILRNNNAGKNWEKKPYEFLVQKWACEPMVAQYHEEKRALIIASNAYSNELDRRKIEDEKKNLQGF
jgi:hypothetical protein